MKYAIIKSGNHQYQVEEGKSLQVELVENTSGPIIFDQVLLVVDGEKVEVGTPTVSGMKVYGIVLKEVKGEKIQVFKYKSKSRYRKLRGHRQAYTLVKIDSIGAAPKAAPVKAEKKAEVKEVKKETVKKTPVKKTAAPKVATKKPVAKKTAK